MKDNIISKFKNLSKVYIVILNWNNYKDTIACLASCKNLTYKNLNIILVDNASSDGSGYKIAEEFPEVEFIYNKENLGYAGGNNRGIKNALENGAEYILVLNNDVVIKSSDLLTKMVSCFMRIPNLGILGPNIFQDYLYSESIHSRFSSGLYNFIKKHFLPKTKLEIPNDLKLNIVERPVVSGSAIMISKRCFETIGFFDEEFFMYGEEDDFCLRTQKNGFIILAMLEENSKVIHKGSSSINNLSDWKVYLSARNRFLQLRSFSLFQQIVIIFLHVGSLIKKSAKLLCQNQWKLIFHIFWGFICGVKIWLRDRLGLSKSGEYLVQGRNYVINKSRKNI